MGTELATIPETEPGATGPTYEQMKNLAMSLAQTDMIPKHLQGRPNDCFQIVNMALAKGLDPFSVAQVCHVIHGKVGFEAKFVIALINSAGPFDKPLNYRWQGERCKPGWICTAYTTLDGEEYAIDFDWETAEKEGWTRKNGSKWLTMPEQMMMYRSASFFGRAICPEVVLGMPTTDELEDIGPRRGEPAQPTQESGGSIVHQLTGGDAGTQESEPEPPQDVVETEAEERAPTLLEAVVAIVREHDQRAPDEIVEQVARAMIDDKGGIADGTTETLTAEHVIAAAHKHNWTKALSLAAEAVT